MYLICIFISTYEENIIVPWKYTNTRNFYEHFSMYPYYYDLFQTFYTPPHSKPGTPVTRYTHLS